MTEEEELELLELEELEAQEAALADNNLAQDMTSPVQSQPKTSVLKAALKGIQDIPTFGFGDEIGGAIQAGLLKLTGDNGSFSDNYKEARDANRAESDAAAEEHPVAYYGPGIAASLPTSAITAPFKAAKGAGLLAKALASAGNAGISGLASGAGSSEADSVSGLVSDTLAGGLAGAAVGGAIPSISGASSGLAKKTAGSLEKVGLSQGRRVLTSGADQLSRRSPVSEDAVREAIQSKAIRPFSTTPKVLERLEGLADEQGEKYAHIISRLEELGVKGPKANTIADQLIEKSASLAPSTMDESLPRAFVSSSEKILEKAGDGGRLGLKQAEGLKRSLQNQARYGRVEETPLNDVRRQIASIVRKSNEDAITEAASATEDQAIKELAGSFVPTKQRLGRLMEARDAAERGAARASQRSAFGLTDYLAAVGGAAHGGGPAVSAAAGLANNLFRNRGTSAMAVGSLKASELLEQIAKIEALRRGSISGRLPPLIQKEGQDE